MCHFHQIWTLLRNNSFNVLTISIPYFGQKLFITALLQFCFYVNPFNRFHSVAAFLRWQHFVIILLQLLFSQRLPNDTGHTGVRLFAFISFVRVFFLIMPLNILPVRITFMTKRTFERQLVDQMSSHVVFQTALSRKLFVANFTH